MLHRKLRSAIAILFCCLLVTPAATVASAEDAQEAPIRVIIGDPAEAQSQQTVSDTCPPFSGTIFPGATITKNCTIVSGGPEDATFLYFLAQNSITVWDADDNVVTGQQRETFISFFRIGLGTQPVYMAVNPTRQDGDFPGPHDGNDFDLAKGNGYRTTCEDKELTELTGDASTPDKLRDTHCRIGRIRAAQQVPFNSRDLQVRLTMLSEGNQTPYAGWAIGFTEVDRALVTALRDCPEFCRPFVGPTFGPVYER